MQKLCFYSWIGIGITCAAWFVSRIPWYYATIGCIVIAYAVRKMRAEMAEKDELIRSADVSSLSPLAYEDYCALALRDVGWNAHTTPLQDQGVDVVAVLRGTKAVIQCKMYTHPVGNRAVQEVIAGRLYYGAHIAVVVSPTVYTCSAMELASRTQVLLLHHDQLPMLERIARIR